MEGWSLIGIDFVRHEILLKVLGRILCVKKEEEKGGLISVIDIHFVILGSKRP